MATNEKDQTTLPLVLLHRSPYFEINPFTDLLSKYFRLLDPLQSQLPPSLLASVRAAVLVAPSQFTAEDLRRLPALELIVTSSAGLNHVDLEACRSRGVSVTGIGDSFTDDTADCAVALLMDVLRRVSAADRFVRSRLWSLEGTYPLGTKVGGKRIGIVGLGKIGSAVAKRLAALGCKIAYNSRNEKPYSPFPYFSSVCDLASNSDALVICCSLTDETHHLVNKSVMEALGKEGVIVNVGRGAIVDEKELVGFLTRGEIGGAGLDVFENEPKVPQELFGMDNVVLSPHAAVLTPESIESVQQIVLDNLIAFFSNKPLVSQIQ